MKPFTQINVRNLDSQTFTKIKVYAAEHSLKIPQALKEIVDKAIPNKKNELK